MNEKEYSVSEAVRLVGVESHVLRYWEEELQVEIRRTAQGHRVYSESNIETFCKVRQLKDRGLQLKAIRVLLDEAEGDSAKARLTEQISEIGVRLEKAEEHTDTKEDEIMQEDHEQDLQMEELHEEGLQEGSNRDLENEDLQKPAENKKDVLEEKKEELYLACHTSVGEIEEQSPDQLSKFEEILKSMICEVIESQNRKQEQALREILREELRQMHFSYEEMLQEAMKEAAAARESRKEKKGIAGVVQRWICRKN